MTAWYLAVDLGTQGPKVAAVASGGAITRESFRGVATSRGSDGHATQQPSEWWQAITEQVRELGDICSDKAPAAIAITGQYGSTVPIDVEGRAIGECILWADGRGGEHVEFLGGRRSTARIRRAMWEKLAAGAPAVSGGDPTGHEHLLRARYPDVWGRTRVLLEPIDYLGLCLTGNVRATPASMIASYLIRLDASPDTPRYSPTLLRFARRDASRLPVLIPTGSILGPLSAQAACELGIAAGTPVVAGIPDLHTAYLGSGAVQPFEAHLVLSSTSWLGFAVNRRYFDRRREVTTVAGVHPGHLLIENSQESAGLALDWAIRTLWSSSSTPQSDIHEQFAAAAVRSPAGSGGVLFAPWLSGERTPIGKGDLRGVFLGLGATTTAQDLARAVIEGLAMNARLLVEGVTAVTGGAIAELRLMGQCARLDELCQIYADVLGMLCHRVHEPQLANLRGAAMFAASAVDALRPPEYDAWVQIDRTFRPNRDHRDVYERLYSRYRKLPNIAELTHLEAV